MASDQIRIQLVTPPMTQLNTPFPATALLTGFFATLEDVRCAQSDLSLELALLLFSEVGVQAMAEDLRRMNESHFSKHPKQKTVRWFLKNEKEIAHCAGAVLKFLQGKDPTLASRLVSRNWLPEGPRFSQLKDWQAMAEHENATGLEWAFGALGAQDHAKYFASLFLDDLSDVATCIDQNFTLARYGEKLTASVASFDALATALNHDSPSLIDRWVDSLARSMLLAGVEGVTADLLAITVPFPGTAYGAFRIARIAKKMFPSMKIAIGGGYVSSELRELTDPRVFDFVDFIGFDEGEPIFTSLIDHLRAKRTLSQLHRVLYCEHGVVKSTGNVDRAALPSIDEIGFPSYRGLMIDRYPSIIEMLNPMHRLWSDGRWNKLMLARGCYWGMCSFCDTSLPCIYRYQPATAEVIVDRMQFLIRETGQTGFHFVDEAAPPALLKRVSRLILERGLTVSWWGNVRFEKNFTPELAQLMAQAGCIGMSGGLEAASDRVLKILNKGVTVKQVREVCSAFSEAGILVHSYLMYGIPGQTEKDLKDALCNVRDLFAEGVLQSAFWHRFSATAHSPMGRDPDRYGIILKEVGGIVSKENATPRFARNDLAFSVKKGISEARLQAWGHALERAVYNYMLGIGFEFPIEYWFGK